MISIVDEVKEVLESTGNALKVNSRVAEYENAILQFESLVKQGLTKKRGNQLLSQTEAHLIAPLALETMENE